MKLSLYRLTISVSFISMCIVCNCSMAGDLREPNTNYQTGDSDSNKGYFDEEVIEEKMLVANFAAEAKCKTTPGLMGVQLPDVPVEISRAIGLLSETHKKDVMADVAAILVRYTCANAEGRGVIVDRKHPLVQAFMSAMKPVLPGDEIISSSLADWIVANRQKMGCSTVLDKEIKEYEKARKRLQIRYEKLAEEGLRSLEKESVPAKP